MNQIRIGSPAHKADLVIGKKYALRINEGDLKAGDLVTFTNDDGSSMPRFDAEGLDGDDGWTYICISDIIVSDATPAQAAGYAIGQKFKVIGGFEGSSIHNGDHAFAEGDIVTLTKDDGSSNPRFYRGNDTSDTQYIYLSDVVAYKETPVEKAGYKIGDKFTVIQNPHGFFKEGAIVTLTRDDESSVPEFTGPDKTTGNTRKGYAALNDVTPFIEPKKTPVQEAGFVVGQKFTLLKATLGWFPRGAIITLTKDDGTTRPEFSGPHESGSGVTRQGYAKIEDIVPYVVAEPVMKVEFNTVLTFPIVLTPAQITAIMAIANKA